MLNGKRGGEMPLLSPPPTFPFTASLHAGHDELASLRSHTSCWGIVLCDSLAVLACFMLVSG